MTKQIIERVDGRTSVTGKIETDPFEYEYIGNYTEVLEVLKHFDENGFEDVLTSREVLDDDGDHLWYEQYHVEPNDSDKHHQVLSKISEIDTPNNEEIKMR